MLSWDIWSRKSELSLRNRFFSQRFGGHGATGRGDRNEAVRCHIVVAHLPDEVSHLGFVLLGTLLVQIVATLREGREFEQLLLDERGTTTDTHSTGIHHVRRLANEQLKKVVTNGKMGFKGDSVIG